MKLKQHYLNCPRCNVRTKYRLYAMAGYPAEDHDREIFRALHDRKQPKDIPYEVLPGAEMVDEYTAILNGWIGRGQKICDEDVPSDTVFFIGGFVIETECCEHRDIWRSGSPLFSRASIIPDPNPEMPEEVKGLYKEASSIFDFSPRGAGALLRLALQILLSQFGGKGNNINSDINERVKSGALTESMAKAYHIVRIVGNDCAHPGQIKIDEDPDMVKAIFDILNFIVQSEISAPNMLDRIFTLLPESKVKDLQLRNTTSS